MWSWSGDDNAKCGIVADVAERGGERWTARATSMGTLHELM